MAAMLKAIPGGYSTVDALVQATVPDKIKLPKVRLVALRNLAATADNLVRRRFCRT